MAWASRISSAALGFVLPMVVGAEIDRRHGTRPWGTLMGMVVGFLMGVAFLVRMTRTRPNPPESRDG